MDVVRDGFIVKAMGKKWKECWGIEYKYDIDVGIIGVKSFEFGSLGGYLKNCVKGYRVGYDNEYYI